MREPSSAAAAVLPLVAIARYWSSNAATDRTVRRRPAWLLTSSLTAVCRRGSGNACWFSFGALLARQPAFSGTPLALDGPAPGQHLGSAFVRMSARL
ncbi:hypothetical protein OAN61_00320 [bacterium]|nr:hypothetical protein [bacterium]